MDKKKIILIFFIAIILFSLFIYSNRRGEYKKEDTKTPMINLEKRPVEINIDEGDILTNNFRIIGNNLGNDDFTPKFGKVGRVVLMDTNNKILGKTYLYKNDEGSVENRKECFFSTNLAYNQTKEDKGILEIRSIPQDKKSDIYVYKINVILNNKPLNLNAGFIPRDGSAFVASPSSDPPQK